MNYTYKITNRGLCSELNTLLGFYQSIFDKECFVYIDSNNSQYFKEISIYDVFDFPENFSKEKFKNSKVVSSNELKKYASKNYRIFLSNEICSKFFSYNKLFQNEINSYIQKFPKDINCFHIRRGDKVGEKSYEWTNRTGRTESKKYNIENYMDKITNNEHPIFIMTDDYKCIQEMKSYLSERNLKREIFYLTEESQNGHSTEIDISSDRIYRKGELIKFFTEIEIAKLSDIFVGTRTSNVYRYIINTCTTNTKFVSLD